MFNQNSSIVTNLRSFLSDEEFSLFYTIYIRSIFNIVIVITTFWLLCSPVFLQYVTESRTNALKH